MVYDFFEELKNIVKEKIKICYAKFKYILLVVSLIALIFSILLFDRRNPADIESQQILLLGISIENWLQWVTIITILYTAGWAIYQYKKNIASKRQEKATQIAKEFSSIVNDLDIIETVYKESLLIGFFPMQEDQIDKFKYFNVEEIRRIFKDDDYVYKYKKRSTLLRKQLDNLYHLELYKRSKSYSILEDYNKLKEKIIRNEIENKETKKIEKIFINNSQIPYHFWDLESNVLNKLEYICMDISNKAADSNYIYQSLHQMFLRCMRFLGVQISIANISSTDKYYTNIIHVYNDWRNKYKKNLKLEEKRIKKSNEALNPKIKTV